jgi:hypothetical protein
MKLRRKNPNGNKLNIFIKIYGKTPEDFKKDKIAFDILFPIKKNSIPVFSLNLSVMVQFEEQ